MGRHIFVTLAFLLLFDLSGCTLAQRFFGWLGPPETGMADTPPRDPALPRLAPAVRPVLDRLLPAAISTLIDAHSDLAVVPARYKRSLAMTALTHPWEGLTHVERQGLLLAELAEGRAERHAQGRQVVNEADVIDTLGLIVEPARFASRGAACFGVGQ